MKRIEKYFHWHNMQKDITEHCISCDICQRLQNKPPKVPMIPIPPVNDLFDRVGIDIVGPLSLTKKRNKYILSLIDYATRYAEAVPLTSKKEKNVAEALIRIFTRLGIPKCIFSDQDPSFISNVMTEFYHLLGIDKINSTPYHPQTNGLVENFQKTLVKMLKKLGHEKPKRWDENLDLVMFAYREMPQKSTGFSPFQLLYGREPRGPLQLVKDQWTGASILELPLCDYIKELKSSLEYSLKLAKENISKSQQVQKEHYDQHTRPRSMEEGNKALILLPRISTM